MSKPTSLLLIAGGGSRGALHVAPLEHVVATTAVQRVVGTSIGAWHAYAVAAHKSDRIRALWEGIRGQQDFMRLTVNPFDGLYSLNPLRRLVEKLEWGLPQLPMHVGVFDFGQATHRLIRVHDRPIDDVLDLCVVSSSIPGIHNASEFEGEYLGDGGAATPLPLPKYLARALSKVDEVHAIISAPRRPLQRDERRDASSAVEQVIRMIEYHVHDALLGTVDRLRRVARRVGTTLYLYAPQNWTAAGPTFDNNDKRLRQLIADRLLHGEWMVDHVDELE